MKNLFSENHHAGPFTIRSVLWVKKIIMFISQSATKKKYVLHSLASYIQRFYDGLYQNIFLFNEIFETEKETPLACIDFNVI